MESRPLSRAPEWCVAEPSIGRASDRSDDGVVELLPGDARIGAEGVAAHGSDASPPPAPRATPSGIDHAILGHDVVQSVQNALKLGMGLMGTWAVALAIRLALPRLLGPAPFGELQFADAFTTTAFIVTSLGVETYVRKEIATRREHASDFFAGTMLLGLVVGVLVMLLSVVGLRMAGKPEGVLQLVMIMGVAQILTNLNAIYAALLHAVGRVSGLTFLNVGSKVLWGVGIAATLSAGYGVRGVAYSMLAAEVVRTLVLAVLARRHVALRLRIDVGKSWMVLVASLPFFVGGVAQTIYARIDVSIMSFLATDTEVGWYGAASTLAGISLLLSPLISWVLLPLTSRAAARSEAELMLVARRAMELVLVAAYPVSLFLFVGSDVLIGLAFGDAFAEAERSLRILAPTFVLTYAAMVSASLLVRLERGWAVTWVSMSGMVIAPTLNLALVPVFYERFGAGGAGMGAATALTLTELVTASAMSWLLRAQAFDRRTAVVMGKTFAVGLAVIALDQAMRHRGFGGWRLLLDGALYLGGVVAWGALDLRAGLGLARSAIASRRGGTAAVAP